MKKLMYVLALLLLPVTLWGETYTSLWKKVTEAQDRDLPRTEDKWLSQIIAKAEQERQYGHLLKAQLRQAALITIISPDSAETATARVVHKAEAAKDPVLRAVYAAALGRLFKQEYNKGEESRKWFARSMENMPLLAAQKTTAYQPAVMSGMDSKIFYNDLLHVIGMEAEAFDTLRNYYEHHGNRAAACICAYYQLMKDRKEDVHEVKKSKYLQTIDSLIAVYGDLREAGELAIEHYNFISQATDATAGDRVQYINYALSRWGAWPRMNVLRNAQSDLLRPTFNINIGDMMLLPQVERKLHINSIRNIDELTINVYRLNVDGSTRLNPSDPEDRVKLQKLILPGTVQTISRRYIGQAPWKENSDSVHIQPLPIGVYLVEAATGNKDIKPDYALLRVSNLYVMHEYLDDDRVRLVVVNATTGRPVPKAHLRLTPADLYHKTDTPQVSLITDKNGEVIYTQNDTRMRQCHVYTDEDHACGHFDIHNNYAYWERDETNNVMKLFTDRAIYRPGQQVHVSAVAYHTNYEPYASKAESHLPVEISLHDANRKIIQTKQVTTDDFGTAATTFTLPANGLTGQFLIMAVSRYRRATTRITVEQYKRPTFEIKFTPCKETYHAGDTVRIQGEARTFSGVPVQGAKVSYTVKRRQSSWWRWIREDDHTLSTDTTVTAGDGTFQVVMPMEFPAGRHDDRSMLYNIIAQVTVTDMAGETHEGETSLPLSNKTTFLTCDLPAQQLRDSLKSITFTRRNLNGQNIGGTVRYRFDNDAWKTAEANTTIALTGKMASGRHRLTAVCEADTVEQDVIVFSLNDKRPAIDTRDWCYLSSSQFHKDGRPVYLQVGSSDEDVHIYYSVHADSVLLEKGSRVISNAIHTERLTYQPSFGDGVVINLAWVKRGHLYTHKIVIRRPEPDNRLRLTWKTFRDRLTPGQKEEWTLQVDRPDGKPAQAQFMATMYDKSLDQINKHRWSFDISYPYILPDMSWNGGSNSTVGLYGYLDFKSLAERELEFDHFDPVMFVFREPKSFYMHAMRLGSVAPSAVRLREVEVHKLKLQGSIGALSDDMFEDGLLKLAKTNGSRQKAEGAGSPQPADAPQIRENLNETAFFFPALTTDANGQVGIRFTLPESVTTWRMMGWVHDKDMNYGQIEAEAVAKKTVMVQPNMPRFIRKGDKTQLVARIANTSEHTVGGTTTLQLLDPETELAVAEWSKPFEVAAGKTAEATFDVNGSQLAMLSSNRTLFIARVMAKGKGFSDGEQHYLPLLPDKEYVTTTLPITQTGAGVKNIDLTKLVPGDVKQGKLTVEYTNHPAWLVVQTLPNVSNPYDHNAISLAAAIYANAVAHHILTAAPQIARTIGLWNMEEGSRTSLTSNLEKNEELKTMLLSETPWAGEATRETDQKRLLGELLDPSGIGYRLETFTKKLEALQAKDGSFSWWPGMPGNSYTTLAVLKILSRMRSMTGTENNTAALMSRAGSYLDRRLAEEVAELKKNEKKGVKHLAPSEMACHYLYTCAINGHPKTGDISYMVSLLEKIPAQHTIYGKAESAVILAKYGKRKSAETFLQSIAEYTVYREDMGRYFDTHKAQYSWCDYRIPSQVAAIEALKALAPDDQLTIEQMKQWLLQEKRTTGWNTVLNTTDAVYAFLTDHRGQADLTKLATGSEATLSVDGKPIETSPATAGIGYVKTAIPLHGSEKTMTIDKNSDGTSWGAVYAQYWQQATAVKSHTAGLHVKRDLTDAHGQPLAGPLHVGQKVKVRITITADRDYDFVQVQDKRAACLEPVQQQSRYSRGCYQAPQDNMTNYYFDQLAKGRHIVETEYYVERTGTFASGICTAQCAYSPEFSARDAALTLKVTK